MTRTLWSGTNTTTDYVRFAGEPVAQFIDTRNLPIGEGSDPATSLRFTFTDHLGTPLIQTDPQRNIVWRAEYEPFGAVYAYRAGDSDDPQVLRFPGQELDTWSGLSYNVFRWYRPEWGRYAQVDQAQADAWSQVGNWDRLLGK